MIKRCLVILLLLLPALTIAQVPIRNIDINSIRNSNNNNSNPNRQRPVDNNNDPYNQDTTVDDTPKGIVFDQDMTPDSVLCSRVNAFERAYRSVKIQSLRHPTLQPTGYQSNNSLLDVQNGFYTSLGALGQVRQPLFYPLHSLHPTPYTLQPAPYNPHPIHYTLNSTPLFQTQEPFTVLGYGSSLNKDYQIHILHTQNIKPRWNIAMLYDLVSRDGLYTNSGVTSHIVDLSTNYYSQDARYQLQASLSFNRIRHSENGGVQNDTTCWDYSRESGVPVNMYSAQNQWRDFEIHLHQSYNTVRQFETIIEHTPDTIHSTHNTTTHDTLHSTPYTPPPDTLMPPKPSTFNSGVFALDISYTRHRRIFSDNQADSWFYNLGSVDTTFFYDSTVHHQLSAELYWTNDAHMQHRWSNPVIITAGIRPQYDELRFAEPGVKTNEFNISPFAKAKITMGRVSMLFSAEEINGDRRVGDYRFDGSLNLGLGRSSLLSISALSQANSPDLIYYYNRGAYSWSVTDYNKTKVQRLAATFDFNNSYLKIQNSNKVDSTESKSQNSIFKIQHSKLSLSSTLLSDNVWFDSQMRPTQGDATALLLQADLSAHLALGWFNIRTHQLVQHTSDNDVVRLPLFASKNSIFADFVLFKGALRTQIGVDLSYHTKYYADAWNPLLGAFYRQDDVQVGDYLVADLWLTLQVKRATIYLRASHLNAPIEKLAGLTPSYFSLPHYPYENFSLYWGLTWRFFD